MRLLPHLGIGRAPRSGTLRLIGQAGLPDDLVTVEGAVERLEARAQAFRYPCERLTPDSLRIRPPPASLRLTGKHRADVGLPGELTVRLKREGMAVTADWDCAAGETLVIAAGMALVAVAVGVAEVQPWLRLAVWIVALLEGVAAIRQAHASAASWIDAAFEASETPRQT